MHSFGEAIEAVKAGKRISRAGWNGKKMFVVLMEGSAPASAPVQETAKGDLINGVNKDLFTTISLEGGETVVRMPCLVLKAADGLMVPGWLASQTDLFAEDWTIAEAPKQ